MELETSTLLTVVSVFITVGAKVLRRMYPSPVFRNSKSFS